MSEEARGMERKKIYISIYLSMEFPSRTHHLLSSGCSESDGELRCDDLEDVGLLGGGLPEAAGTEQQVQHQAWRVVLEHE